MSENHKAVTRRNFLAMSGLAASAILLKSCGSLPERKTISVAKPNVILIITDDQGYADLACHGNPALHTPNLDKIYDQSVRFDNFFVSPLCQPTRVSMLSGHYVPIGRGLLQKDTCLAEMMRKTGYNTGIFGKWHLRQQYPYRPEDEGFQEVFCHGGGGIGQLEDYWGNTNFGPTIKHNGTWEKTNGYCTDVFFDAAMKWVEQNRNQPFFCYLSTNAAHSPYQVSEKYSAPYRKKGLDQETADFYGMITNIDENIGRLTEKLRQLGLQQKTLLIFLTDNGSAMADNEKLFNAGLRGGKGSVYEGGSKAACFFHWPTVLKPKTVKQMAAHYDIVQTLAEICNTTHPNPQQLEGISLVPYLKQTKTKLRDRYFISYLGFWPPDAPLEKYRNYSVRTSRFRLVNNDQLYDLKNDPGETTNVIDKHPAALKKIRSFYDRWWQRVKPEMTKLRITERIPLGVIDGPIVLNCLYWKESRIAPGAPKWYDARLWLQSGLEDQIRDELSSNPTKQSPMGTWPVEFARSGTYKLTLSKASESAPDELKSLKQGRAFVLLNQNLVQKEISEGALSVSVQIKAKKGPAELECWFGGQRPHEEPSGAYFVRVEIL